MAKVLYALSAPEHEAGYLLAAALDLPAPDTHQAHAERACANLTARGPELAFWMVQPWGVVWVGHTTAERLTEYVRSEVRP
jgi:hypothetical protein